MHAKADGYCQAEDCFDDDTDDLPCSLLTYFHSRLQSWVATAGGHFEHFVQYTKWEADVNHLNF